MEVISMNTLLIFFALPIAVIIVSAILQKVLKWMQTQLKH